jgi:hypothetical protein
MRLNIKSLAFIREGAAILEKLMSEGGIPSGVKLQRIEATTGGILFHMENGMCWKATVKLTRTDSNGEPL